MADELKRVLTGEAGREFEMLVGERVKSLGLAEKIKVAKGVDLEALVKDDGAPFFVYAKALKVGVSKNMKRYAKKHLQAFLDALPLYGFEGHPPKPVPGWYQPYRGWRTAWVGGVIIEDWLYVKGYVPPEWSDFRKAIERSLAVGKPMTVSIWAEMTWLERQNGISDVVELKPVSIDWADPGEEGVEGAEAVEVSGEVVNQTQEDRVEKREIVAGLTFGEIKRDRPDLVEEAAGEFRKSTEYVELKAKAEKLGVVQGELAQVNKDVVANRRTALLGEITDEAYRKAADRMLAGETVKELETNFTAVKAEVTALAKKAGVELFGETKKMPAPEKKPVQTALNPRFAGEKKS